MREPSSLRKWRESHLLIADFILALALAGAVVGVLLPLCTVSEIVGLLNGNRASIYGTIASITGSLLGFILAAVSIVSVFAGMPAFKLLHDANRYKDVFDVFFNAVNWLALGTAVALLGLVADRDASPNAWVALVAYVIMWVIAVSVWRCIWLLKAISAIATTPRPQTQPKSVTE